MKAHWLKKNISPEPPRTHNLVKLESQTDLNMPFENVDKLQIMNTWQSESRYFMGDPDSLADMTPLEIESWMETANQIRQWLLEQLP